jgi:hypothetical protein
MRHIRANLKDDKNKIKASSSFQKEVGKEVFTVFACTTSSLLFTIVITGLEL